MGLRLESLIAELERVEREMEMYFMSVGTSCIDPSVNFMDSGFLSAASSPFDSFHFDYAVNKCESPPPHSDDWDSWEATVFWEQVQGRAPDERSFLAKLRAESGGEAESVEDVESVEAVESVAEAEVEEAALRAEAEMREALASLPRRPPPYPGYVCHACGETDHHIDDCTFKHAKTGAKPYHGGRVSQADFRCGTRRCAGKWSAVLAPNDPFPPCPKCRRNPVKAYKMFKLGQGSGGEKAKPGKNARPILGRCQT